MVKKMTQRQAKSEEEERIWMGVPNAPSPVSVEQPMRPCVWRFMLAVGVLIYSSYTIFVHLCEVDGQIPFSSASMVLLTEMTKFGLCCLLIIPEVKRGSLSLPSLKSTLPFALPAILYCINNNIAVHIQLQMDPASYQVLGNLKILSTAFLYRLIIKRPVTSIQWVALGILAIAGACNSYSGMQAEPDLHSATQIHVSVKGFLMICTYCCISGLAGVYTEYILKKKYDTSIHLQNGLLYTFGMIINGGVWLLSTFQEGGTLDLFAGYSLYTWLLIVSQAVSGLIMSSIMKHGNNITRLFLISCAMLVTTVLSMLIFGLQLNTYFCVSFSLVLLALSLYHIH